MRRRKKSDDSAEQTEKPIDWSPDRHREITGEEVVELLPAMAEREPTGGFLFYDCQTDDVRLVLSALDEATRYGAVCVNRGEVTGLVESGGRATGVQVTDSVSGQQFEIGASNVVNATGVWADRLRPGELRDEAEVPRIRPSRGTHILLSEDHLHLEAGAIVPTSDGRFIFALPWLGRSLIGTTDTDYDSEDLDHVPPRQEDVEYLLDAVNAFFECDIKPADVVGAFAGVRPLIAPADSKKSVDISRHAELYETSSGMITITGGKLTTWRAMAEMTVDRIVERDGGTEQCRTRNATVGVEVDPDTLPRVEGVPEDSYRALADRYGGAAVSVLEVAAERGELAQPIVPGLDDILAEAIWAIRRQQALTLSDVLLRRTRIGLLAGRELSSRESEVLGRVSNAVGAELGWSEADRERQIEDFLEEAEAEGISVPEVEPV
jgi:glycerol-3-phosphate dehydrogenase